MNPFIEKKLQEIDDQVEDLGEVLDETREQLKEKQDAFVELTQQYWTRGRQISVLNQNEQDFAKLRDENEAFRAREDDVRQRLERVLAHVKALSAGFRS